MAPRFDLICFGEDWYKASFSSSRQISLRMKEGRKLLWVNPLPIRLPSVSDRSERRAFWRKLAHKLKTHLRLLSRVQADVWVLSPLYLPIFLSERGDRINSALLTLQVWLAARLLRLKRPLILATATYHPFMVARRLRHHRFFYYYADMMRAFTDLPAAKADRIRELYEKYDRAICHEADRVYCASRAIYEDILALTDEDRKIAYLPHGVDFDHFNAAREGGLPVPPGLAELPRPVVGYFGSLTNHNNKNILRLILERHPDWSVVLIGKVVGDYTSLAECPNLHLTGAVPYAQLPAWAQVFDIGIMNWHLTDWIAGSFPVKAQEYLALGLPVVSVRIAELEEQYGDLIRIADDDEEFVRCVEEELAADSEERRAERVERVRGRDWSRLARRMLSDAGE